MVGISSKIGTIPGASGMRGRTDRLALAIFGLIAGISVLATVFVLTNRDVKDPTKVVIILKEIQSDDLSDSAQGFFARTYNEIMSMLFSGKEEPTGHDSAHRSPGDQGDGAMASTVEPPAHDVIHMEDSARNGPPEQHASAPTDTAGETDHAAQSHETADRAHTPTAPMPEKVAALSPAPDVALIETSAHGPLPRIGPKGRMPMDVYARPFENPEGLPQIAIVIGNLGISRTATLRAINNLPPEVSLAFTPYGSGLQEMIDNGRKAGHEALLHVPMEPFNYPDNDPGPLTLRTSLTRAENINLLRSAMGSFAGYVGILNFEGAKLTKEPEAVLPIMDEVRSRGLFFLEDGHARHSVISALAERAHLLTTKADELVDERPTRSLIDQRLANLEQIARQRGYAIGVGNSWPVSIEQIDQWADTLASKGLILAPLSALMKPKEDGDTAMHKTEGAH